MVLMLPFIVSALPSALAFQNLVTFGDSFTDVIETGDGPGAQAWPVYATGYSNTSLFPFARSGATCSNNITFRPFPSLFESQLPAYFNTSLDLDPNETLYSLWIGTNDVGRNSLLTGSNNASIVDVTRCMVNWVKVLYEEGGARNFLFQNMVPLQHIPMYSANSYLSPYWFLPRNSTEWNVLMTELVLSGNELNKLLLEALAPTLPEAHIAIFDSYSLFQDMLNNPSLYLNGTAPLNTTGAIHACVLQEGGTGETCTDATGTDVDSFLWYDELHPSEQADRKVAEQVAQVLQGEENRWTTWLS